MSVVEHWREKLASAAGSLIAAASDVRRSGIRERLSALAGSAGSRWPMIVVSAAALVTAGMIVWASAREFRNPAKERDCEDAYVCAGCGHNVAMTRQEMFDAIAAAKSKGIANAGADMRGPFGICPKCGKFALYRIRRCPKCNKPIAPPFATIDGVRVAQRCWGCGWSAKP